MQIRYTPLSNRLFKLNHSNIELQRLKYERKIYMEGSVRKRGKKWYYYFDAAKVNGNRQRIERVGGKTKAEALSALRIAIQEYENGDFMDLSDISVADYFDYWLSDYVKRELRPRTYDNYKNVVEKYIKPAIGMYKLKSIGPAKLQEFMNDLGKTMLSKRSVEVIATVMNGGFKRAVFPYQLIKTNPAEYVTLPKFKASKKTKKKIDVISMEQFEEILSLHPYASPFRLPFLIAFHTGLRIGEVAALTWADISFSDKTLTVDKQMTMGKKGDFTIIPPKTESSNRTIKIDEQIIAELKKAKQMQSENRLRYGKHYYDSNFVCTKEDGSPCTVTVIRYHASNTKEKVGYHFNFHMLRHTHATMLLEGGAIPKSVQQRLGHSKIAVTMDTYVHVTEVMETDTIDILSRKLSEKKLS